MYDTTVYKLNISITLLIDTCFIHIYKILILYMRKLGLWEVTCSALSSNSFLYTSCWSCFISSCLGTPGSLRDPGPELWTQSSWSAWQSSSSSSGLQYKLRKQTAHSGQGDCTVDSLFPECSLRLHLPHPSPIFIRLLGDHFLFFQNELAAPVPFPGTDSNQHPTIYPKFKNRRNSSVL